MFVEHYQNFWTEVHCRGHTSFPVIDALGPLVVTESTQTSLDQKKESATRRLQLVKKPQMGSTHAEVRWQKTTLEG